MKIARNTEPKAPMPTRAQELLDQINATLKGPVLKMGSDKDLLVEYWPTGILPMDMLLQGGIPKGRFVEIVGDYCLVPETLVLNGDCDWVPLGSLRVGDPIVGFDEEPQKGRGQQRQLQRAHVERVTTKTLPCYELETDKGTQTVASIGHKWLVLNQSQRHPEWRTTESIGIGDKIAYYGDVWGQAEDRESASYLAGLFDGEGWVDACRVSFAQNPGPVLDYGIKLLEGMGFSVSVRETSSDNVCMAVSIKGGYRELMRFASQVPTIRLAPKIEQAWVGTSLTRKGRNADPVDAWATVTKIRYVGARKVIAIGTSTKTLVADGMFTHNSTLKSFIGLKAIATTQASGGVCALIDTEHSYDPTWAAALGINTDTLIVQQPETGELAMDTAEALIRGKCDLIVFDSIAASLPQTERNKRLHEESVQPARQAQLMSLAMRKLTAANSKTAMVWINQTRLNVGVTFGNPESLPGGRAMPYYSSYRINMKKVGKITRDVQSWDGEKMVNVKEQVGQKFKAIVEKSKLSKPFRDVYFTWDYETGEIDEAGYLIALGLEAGLITQKGASWNYEGETWRGKAKFKEAVMTDTALQARIKEAVIPLGFPGNPEAPKRKGR